MNGATKKVKVAPLAPDDYRDVPQETGTSDTSSPNGAAQPASPATNGVIPPSAGARIPIAIGDTSTANNGASAPIGQAANGSGAVAQRARAAQAAIPDVMADDDPISPILEDESDPYANESVEERVQRLRPKSLRLQFRYFYTLLFALWLFGRLAFWQVYVAKLFPNWVKNRNTQRWRKYAREFSAFAERMGGVQIKAGQFASTRADVLPEEVIMELAGLQDSIATLPYKRIYKVIVDELGDPDERFAYIDEEPIAAASLGQVHRGRLKSGEDVVVKVQRPGVRDIIYTDMAAMFIVGHISMTFDFVSRRSDSVMIIEEFGRILLEEIDYHKERENARRFVRMFANDPGVYVPAIYEEHSSERVIVLEDVTAIKIDDYARLAAAGIDREEVARRLMDTYLEQIFEQRFFHADPHPGNLFVYPLPVEDEAQYVGKGGRPFYLIFIDFGMTATLRPEIVQGLINTLVAVLTRDAKKLVASYQELGFLLPGADVQRITEATERVFGEVWGLNMTELGSMDFEVIENIGKEFGDLLSDMPFRIPQDFVYLGRTVSILAGMATKLDPTFNPWDDIQRNMQHLVTSDLDNNIFDELGKVFQQTIDELIADGPQGFVRVTERIINRLQRFNRTEKMLQQIIDGDVQLPTKLSSQHRYQLERIEAQGRRTSRLFVSGSLLVCATLLYTNGDAGLAIVSVIGAGYTYVSSWFIVK